MIAHWCMVKVPNADGQRCIYSDLVNVLTKSQGGAILLVECTKIQELEEIENGTNRE